MERQRERAGGGREGRKQKPKEKVKERKGIRN